MKLTRTSTQKEDPLIAQFSKLIRHFQRVFKEKSINEALDELIQSIQYNSYIEKQYERTPKQVERRKNDVSQFVESAKRFSQRGPVDGNLKNFVEKLLLQDSQTKKDSPDEEETTIANEVSLMTLHSSKGLEFDLVYLVGMEEETLPHKKIIQEGGDINEERRLCYVGITRAKKKLIMTYCKERVLYGKNRPVSHRVLLLPSRKGNFILNKTERPLGTLMKKKLKNTNKIFFQTL